MRKLLPLAFSLLSITDVAAADQNTTPEATLATCSQLEATGGLIHQLLKQSKICKGSRIDESWTDCEFQAGKTRILLAGAIGTTMESRIMGISGSGFHLLSVDPAMTVRAFVDSAGGLVLRLDEKDNLLPTGCLYNEALITLDARVLGPGERVAAGPAPTWRDSIRSAQSYLRELGYDPGPVDGELGRRTRAALEQYKRDRGIAPETSEDTILARLLLEALKAADKKLK